MPILIRDIVVRRGAQFLLLAFFGFLVTMPLLAVGILFFQWIGALYGDWADIAQFALRLISLPLVDSTSQVMTVLFSVFPIVVTSVCYLGTTSTSPPSLTDRLNRVGYVSIVLLLVGAVFSAIGVVTFNMFPKLVESINQSPTETGYAKGVLGGILAFQVLYVSKLLGWEKDQ